MYSTVPYQGNFEEQAIVYVKRLLCHQKAARWKKEKPRRVRPSTVTMADGASVLVLSARLLVVRR